MNDPRLIDDYALRTYALRTIDAKFPPIKDRGVTLIRTAAGLTLYATTVKGKRDLLEIAPAMATYLAVWTGNYTSDVFAVPPDRVVQWIAELTP